EFFNECPNLETLIVHANLLANVLYNDTNGKSFRHLTHLKVLDLSWNRMETVPNLLLKNQNELQILNISNNEHDNKAMFQNFRNYELRTTFPHDSSTTFIYFENVLIELKKSCYDYTGLIAGITSAFVLAISLTVSGIVYRYRWKLRYLFYMAKQDTRDTQVWRPTMTNEMITQMTPSYRTVNRTGGLSGVTY
ncbi:uncharacterized protein LOC110462416, partial [Mizuhopecten yessoensis]|uniref:uncharacterized protein LOC110462416 n=1 Tax=Mizuhopecten yessoensis TaxID=6573 RepID=UPI000B45CDFE